MARPSRAGSPARLALCDALGARGRTKGKTWRSFNTWCGCPSGRRATAVKPLMIDEIAPALLASDVLGLTMDLDDDEADVAPPVPHRRWRAHPRQHSCRCGSTATTGGRASRRSSVTARCRLDGYQVLESLYTDYGAQPVVGASGLARRQPLAGHLDGRHLRAGARHRLRGMAELLARPPVAHVGGDPTPLPVRAESRGARRSKPGNPRGGGSWRRPGRAPAT